MAGSTATTVPLTDSSAPLFLDALERSGGSIHAAANAVAVKRMSVYARRYEDPQFRNALDAIRTRQRYDVSDQLFSVIDEMVHLIGWEGAMDELVNMMLHDELVPEPLAAVREQLRTAATKMGPDCCPGHSGGALMAAVSKTTSVDLSAEELAFVRALLFHELYDGAGALAEQAAAAANGGDADCENIAGDDAHGTWRHCLQVTTELLDKVGWSVRTDTAVLVEFERGRRVS